MAPVQLKAAPAGFYYHNGASEWAPGIFRYDDYSHFMSFSDLRFIWDDPSGTWRVVDYPENVLDIVLQTSITFPDPLSDNVVASITAVTYWRYEDGQRIKIGEMVFPRAAPAVVEGRIYEDAGGRLVFDGPGRSIAARIRQEGLVFRGGSGADYLNFEGGNSLAQSYGFEDAPILAYGYGGADILIGTYANDTIYGGSGADILTGGDRGHDLLFGGDGDDTLGLSDSGEAYGGAGNDRIDIYNTYRSQLPSQIYGGAGNDVLYLYNSAFATISGGSGHDYIVGSGLTNQLYGGQGNDTIYAGSGENTLSGDAGSDRIFAGVGNDSVHGGGGNDELFGGDGQDTLHGDAGADALGGGHGNDKLYGGAGHDGLSGETGRDVLSGGEGNDTLYGGAGADLLMGDAGNDLLYAGFGADSLFGGAGRDVLFAYAGQATLDGGAGRDTLYAEQAGGQMTGGADADVFVFGLLDKHWVITDFENDLDTIRVPNFWGGMTRGQIIQNHAAVVDGNTVISLGGGGTITVLGVDDPELLRNDLVLI